MTQENEYKKILLISMLPGLGKSTLARNNSNVIDYEDWMEVRGLQYKGSDHKHTWDHLSEMIIMAEGVTETQSTLYVFSSIHWEHMNEPKVKTGLYVNMLDGLYNCEEVTNRGRPDLCFFGDELDQWNKDYEPKMVGNSSIRLDSMEFLAINDIVTRGLDNNALEIKDGLEIIT